ncbi:MAG: putative DNA binding domain-containing protein [Zoogloeaceae bacterium]|jgi:ATP-dependent DNA helicase RecG|nr:putative DNA binding domain-containing protein [Zoogloeaceae bacterium]
MVNDLDVILNEGESYTVEFKESADKSLPSEVCAFANASGGKVFIGVKDSGQVVGTDVSNAARSRIQDTINQIEPRLKVDIKVQDNIIIVTVPEGTHKPYSCARGFYLRSGPNSQKLERSSIIEFFQNEGRVRYDEIVREDLTLSERFNETAYRQYVKLAKISKALDRDAILRNLNCAGISDGKLCFTNAGALFFRLNDEDIMFRHAGIVCALYKGTDKAYILDAKELNGDIVSNIDDAMVFLKKHLRVSYKIETLQRQNILELPEDALREAVVNAVCHRDYFEKGARAMVEIYDDRVDIVSPGGVCKGITRENFGTVSITRNSVIASMLYRIGYIEQMGTGIMRMKNAAKAAKAAEPVFELAEFFKVTFKRNLTQSPAASDEQAIDKRLTSDKKRAIRAYIETHGKATVSEVATLLGLSKGRVRAILQEMANDGTVGKAGNNRYACYVLKASDWQAIDERLASDWQAIDKRLTSDKKRAIRAYIEKHGKATVSEMADLLGLSKGRVRAILQEMAKDGTIEKAGSNRYAWYALKASD